MWNEFKNIVEINCDKFIPKTHTFDSWKKKDWKCPIPIEVRSLIKKRVDFGRDTWKLKIKTF